MPLNKETKPNIIKTLNIMFRCRTEFIYYLYTAYIKPPSLGLL